MVLPPGIEPGSTVLQTAAMTTSAKAAFLGRMMGIEPTRRESQSRMLPLHHRLHCLVPLPRVERELKLSQSFVISLSLQWYLFPKHLFAS